MERRRIGTDRCKRVVKTDKGTEMIFSAWEGEQIHPRELFLDIDVDGFSYTLEQGVMLNLYGLLADALDLENKLIKRRKKKMKKK